MFISSLHDTTARHFQCLCAVGPVITFCLYKQLESVGVTKDLYLAFDVACFSDKRATDFDVSKLYWSATLEPLLDNIGYRGDALPEAPKKNEEN
jgi:hypothetical protein